MAAVRILYLVTGLDPGGAERQLAALACGLDRKAFDPAVASLSPPGTMAAPLRQAGVPVFSLGARKGAALQVLLRLKRLLEETGPDLLHTFLFHANVAGRIGARLAGLPCPVAASVRVEDPRPLHRWGELVTARWADAFVANSEAMGRFLTGTVGLPADKVTVIPNAALPLPETVPGAFRASLGIGTGAPLIVAAGRLDRQKGFDLLIRALPAGCHLALVGEGPERERLGRLAKGKPVHFPGRLPSAAPALADATLVALPSRWEGMPNVAMEAMALGRPVLGTRVGGLPELLGDEALLVPPEDAAGLAAAISGLLRDPARLERLGERLRSRVARYGVARMVCAHEALYTGLLAERAA